MYLKLAGERVQKLWHGLTGHGRSSVFPLLAILVVLLVPSGIWMAHRHAKFHSLEQKIAGAPQEPEGPLPGGRVPIVLTLKEAGVSSVPEFSSVTLLPGLGMDVLQITATIPHHGEVPLLMGPTVQQVADGTAQPDGMGDVHGALELPWSGSLEGLPTPLGTTQTESWEGRTVTTPTDAGGQPGLVRGGLLRFRDADDANRTSDGSGASAYFSATDFDEHWFSKTETRVRVALQANSLELTVDAKNVGDEAEPLGIGWNPRFAILGGRRGAITLKLPEGERLEYADKIRHSPTGKMVPEGAALEPFVSHGEALGDKDFDEALAQMKPYPGEAGPAAEMRDAEGGYGLRMTGMSSGIVSTIRELRVVAPADKNFVALGMQTNYDSPLSRTWTGDEAITTLKPGETLEWKVRLEIFPVSAGKGR
jgi:galactose mutarotase-like enzyme